MASCPHCKADLPEVGRFCAACGAGLGDDPAATRKIITGAAAITNKTILPAEQKSAAATMRVDRPPQRRRLGGLLLLCASVALASSVITVLVYRSVDHSEPREPVVAAQRTPGQPVDTALSRAPDELSIDDAASLRRVRGVRAARERAGSPSPSERAAPPSERAAPPSERTTPPSERAAAAVAPAKPAAEHGASLYDGVSKVGQRVVPAPATRTDAPAATEPQPTSIRPTPPATAAITPATPAVAPPATTQNGAKGSGTVTTPATAPVVATPGVYLGDVNAEEAPPSEAELTERRRQDIFADGIRFVMKTHQVQVGACYERVMKDEDQAKGGRVEMEFTVDKEGKARKVQVVSNTTGKETLGKCLQQRIADWKFPRPPTGDYHASYPFIFAPGSGR